MNILFVCTGNACRSVLAEGIFAAAATAAGFDARAASAGIAASPLFRVPSYVVKYLTRLGREASEYRPRPVTREIVDAADLILVMEERHVRYFNDLYATAAHKVFLLRPYAGMDGPVEIPDPIGKPVAVYEEVVRDIERCIVGLFRRFNTNVRQNHSTEKPMSYIKMQDPEIFSVIEKEMERERTSLELIASENHTSLAVMEAQGSVLTNKYAEGYPGKRYYGGCEFVDMAETIAIDRAKKLFGCEHVNVQPHSGTQANIAVLMALLTPGDTIMGLSLAHGGHLSHGHPLNFSGKFFKIVPYSVKPDTEVVDYDELERLAREHKPKMIMTGASAYSLTWDWARLRKISDEVGALLMADVAHYAGLIAAGIYPSPVPFADVVTTTTHKTLRGPRGGMIMCKEKYAKDIDRAVFPGDQGGPLMHVIAAKAVAFGEALTPAFKEYQKQILLNARAFAAALVKGGLRIVSGGTDCHMFLVDLRPLGVKGKDAQHLLESVGITVNKNAIPYDPEKPAITSGIRIGTPAITTRGMKEAEMATIAGWIVEVLKNPTDAALHEKVRAGVKEMCKKFPLY